MPKTILIVDGNEVEREGLAVVLSRRGYAVAQAENGLAALEYLKANPQPDVIVTDMMMPVMDGWTFLTRRQKLTAIAAIPTIILTGLGVASQDWRSRLALVLACGSRLSLPIWCRRSRRAGDRMAAAVIFTSSPRAGSFKLAQNPISLECPSQRRAEMESAEQVRPGSFTR